LYTRPGITQLPAASSAGHLILTTNKTKTQTQSSANRITTLYSPDHHRQKKKKKYLLPLEHKHKSHPVEVYANHWINPTYHEQKPKRRWNSTSKTEKDIPNTILKKKNAEKY